MKIITWKNYGTSCLESASLLIGVRQLDLDLPRLRESRAHMGVVVVEELRNIFIPFAITIYITEVESICVEQFFSCLPA